MAAESAYGFVHVPSTMFCFALTFQNIELYVAWSSKIFHLRFVTEDCFMSKTEPTFLGPKPK